MSEWFPVTNLDEVPFDIDIITELDDEVEVLSNPNLIYEYLKDHIIGQDSACKASAIFLWNHLNGRPQRMIMTGHSGCGKTMIWQTLADIYEGIIIVDASAVTRTGFTGESACSWLYQIPKEDKDVAKLVVFDEIDKTIAPEFVNGENVSLGVQGEYLSLVQPQHDYIRLHASQAHPDGNDKKFKISTYSYVFCGAFDSLATNLAEKESSSGLGFGAIKTTVESYSKPLTLDDIIEFGMIRELASRLQKVVCLNNLTEKDFINLVTKFNNSPVSIIEKSYHLPAGFVRKRLLSNKKLKELAVDAYKSGLGIRSINAAIQSEIDNWIFNHFEEYDAIKI